MSPTGACATVVPDMVPAVEAAWSVDGRAAGRAARPCRRPLLLYDRRAFQRAGLDPDDPPATLDEVRAASRAAGGQRGATGTGLVVDTELESGGSWFVEQWAAQAGEPSLLPANGRDGRRAETVGLGRRRRRRLARRGWPAWSTTAWPCSVGAQRSGARQPVPSGAAGPPGGDDLPHLRRPGRRAGAAGRTANPTSSWAWRRCPAPAPGTAVAARRAARCGWRPASRDDRGGGRLAARRLPGLAAGQRRVGGGDRVRAAERLGRRLEPLRQAWAERPRAAGGLRRAGRPGRRRPRTWGRWPGPLAELHELLAVAVARCVDGAADPDEALADAAADGDRLLAAYNAGDPARLRD